MKILVKAEQSDGLLRSAASMQIFFTGSSDILSAVPDSFPERFFDVQKFLVARGATRMKRINGIIRT